MKKSLFSMSISALLASISNPTMAQEDLIYVSVSPCRIVDTRSSTAGIIAANQHRPFLVSGTGGALAGQGGNDCADPKAGTGLAPLAISAYVLAVADVGTSDGVLTAYPSDQAVPVQGAGSTVNFSTGANIGNTTNITLCDPSGCPSTGEFEILARTSAQHVVVDVQGYYYSASAATSCPDDMVAAGSVCMDKYEASLWDAATGGSQIPATTCSADGSDCGKDAAAATPIYAQSVVNVTPTSLISWYQAVQACANVGKRLPTTAEWQMAASGTPSGTNSVPADSCNTSFTGVAVTGASALGTTPCASSIGAFDMVGNLWEWTAELTDFTTGGSFSFANTDDGWGRILGGSYNSGSNDSTQDIATVGGGPGLATNSEIGFRCVR